MGLSVLARGSLSEKLLWTFNLYDINGDGIITKEEMLDIVTSIYDMMGRFTENTIEERTAKEHVDNVFQVWPENGKTGQEQITPAAFMFVHVSKVSVHDAGSCRL